MSSQSQQMEQLRSMIPPEEVFTPDHPQYKTQSQPWSNYAELHPQMVIQPTALTGLQKVVKYLYDSDLDFAIRNTGTGSVSVQDVILSMHGFKDFEFDQAAGTVVLGGGLDWGEADRLMDSKTPDYALVGARCSWAGVAGSTLVGGLSWLSHEFGMISDPQNLLDAQVVLGDGRVLWASEEPDLLWALRGGGGNFGVVTALKMRARPYTQKIFSGIVTLPYSSLVETSRWVAAMAAKAVEPKLAMHVTNIGPGIGYPDSGSRPGIAIMMYDANGEAHGRSDAGFGELYKLPGAQEVMAREFRLAELSAMAEPYRDYQGNNMFWLSAPLLENIDDETLVRAWKWYEDSIDLHPGLGRGSAVLLEFMQENAFNLSGGRAATAWPHSGRRHVMQLVLGRRPEGAPPNVREIVMKQFARAGPQIALDKQSGEFHAGFLHEWNDSRQVFGENLDKLKLVKARYDPKNRFNKGVDLVGEKVTEGATV